MISERNPMLSDPIKINNVEIGTFENDFELIKNYDLLSKIINFPIYLEKFTLERSPHSLVHFTKELAANYHSFYEQNPVITDNQEESNARLLITKATSIVLKNSFKIIGVTPLEKM